MSSPSRCTAFTAARARILAPRTSPEEPTHKSVPCQSSGGAYDSNSVPTGNVSPSTAICANAHRSICTPQPRSNSLTSRSIDCPVSICLSLSLSLSLLLGTRLFLWHSSAGCDAFGWKALPPPVGRALLVETLKDVVETLEDAPFVPDLLLVSLQMRAGVVAMSSSVQRAGAVLACVCCADLRAVFVPAAPVEAPECAEEAADCGIQFIHNHTYKYSIYLPIYLSIN